MKRNTILALLLALMLALSACGAASGDSTSVVPPSTSSTSSTQSSSSTVVEVTLPPIENGAYVMLSDEKDHSEIKNVIYLIGDGMGFANIDAARWHNFSTVNQNSLFAMETLPFKGSAHTASMTTLTALDENGTPGGMPTDSAAAGTALGTGVKTKNGSIGLDANNDKLVSLIEAAKIKGMKTGVLTTKTISDATPAGFLGHAIDRGDSTDIFDCIIDSGTDVLVGSYPFSSTQYDGHKAILEGKGYTVTKDADIFRNLNSGKATGFFDIKNGADITLAEATETALKLLTNENGFIMMIEGGAIDDYAHACSMSGMSKQLRGFDDAVAVAIDYAKENKGTLIVLTADHETGGIVMPENPTDKSQINDKIFTEGVHFPNDVPVYAFGPKAHLLAGGVIDNTDIARFIANELELNAMLPNFKGDFIGDKNAKLIEVTEGGVLGSLLTGNEDKSLKVRTTNGARLNGDDLSALAAYGGEKIDLRFSDVEDDIFPAIFRGNTDLMAISLPLSVKNISDYAFRDCSSLNNAVISYKTLSIGKQAFRNTALVSLCLPNGIKEIPDNMLRGVKTIKTLDIPLGVTRIGNWAFAESGIEKLVVPSSVDEIDFYCFYKAESLVEVTFKDANPPTLGNYGGSYNTFHATDDGARSDLQIYVPEDYIEAYKAADGWNLYGANLISKKADGVITVYETGTLAKALENATSKGLKIITEGENALLDASDVTALLDYGIEIVDFSEAKFTKDTFPASGFSGSTTVEKIVFPEGLKAIGDEAFRNCENLIKVVLPQSLTSIGDGCFRACVNLETVEFPKTVTKIGGNLFRDCASLKSFTVQETVVSISYWAFADCESLTEIVIPASVKSIDFYSFYNSKNLSSITFLSETPPKLGAYQDDAKNTFNGTDFKIFVPEGAVEAYKAAGNFAKSYSDKIFPIEK